MSTGVGIDIGATAIHVATSSAAHAPVKVINLDDPDWHTQLISLIPLGAVVACEPTGWHYSAPIMRAVNQVDCQLVTVQHATTGQIRALRIAGVKTDKTDARALAYAAEQAAAGTPLRGTRPVDPTMTSEVDALRLMILAHRRAVKETTRTINRLQQIAHAISPSLAQGIDAYATAIERGYITPQELSIALNDKTIHHLTRRALTKVCSGIPPYVSISATTRTLIGSEVEALNVHRTRAGQLEGFIGEVITTPPFAHLFNLWSSVPGAGVLSLAPIIAACHASAEIMSLAEFKASLGSHPRRSESGETKQTSASRQGFKPGKAALYLWTMSLIRMDNNAVAERFKLAKARNARHAIRIARAKLCEILWAIARTGKPYDPHYTPRSERSQSPVRSLTPEKES
ncbi:MAG: transposase [Anaerolineae bacterium]|nr:transposase [Anaerolineae bacterium]